MLISPQPLELFFVFFLVLYSSSSDRPSVDQIKPFKSRPDITGDYGNRIFLKAALEYSNHFSILVDRRQCSVDLDRPHQRPAHVESLVEVPQVTRRIGDRYCYWCRRLINRIIRRNVVSTKQQLRQLIDSVTRSTQISGIFG